MAKDTSRKRPSRLLNLNKASTLNKRVSSDNARHSPLLSLPPEIRSSIWDYVFRVGTIHIAWDDHLKSYELWMCQHPEAYEVTPPRVSHERSRNNKDYSLRSQYYGMRHHDNCVWKMGTRTPLHQYLHLDLIGTCRLVHHETVLKSFSLNTFQCIAKESEYENTFRYFMNALVPAQIKAIKRMHTTSVNNVFMLPTMVRQFTGLKELDIQMVFNGNSSFWYRCEFADKLGVTALRDLSLKSLRIIIKLRCDDIHLTKAKTKRIIIWQKNLEDRLLKRTAVDEKPDQ